MERSASGSPSASPMGNVAIGLAVAAAVLLVIFAIAGIESALWLIVGALGLAAAVVGWRAGGGQPRGLILGATVAGAVIAVVVILWGIFGS